MLSSVQLSIIVLIYWSSSRNGVDGGFVILASWKNHFIRVGENLVPYPCNFISINNNEDPQLFYSINYVSYNLYYFHYLHPCLHILQQGRFQATNFYHVVFKVYLKMILNSSDTFKHFQEMGSWDYQAIIELKMHCQILNTKILKFLNKWV